MPYFVQDFWGFYKESYQRSVVRIRHEICYSKLKKIGKRISQVTRTDGYSYDN